jgi:hypothetical protein
MKIHSRLALWGACFMSAMTATAYILVSRRIPVADRSVFMQPIWGGLGSVIGCLIIALWQPKLDAAKERQREAIREGPFGFLAFDLARLWPTKSRSQDNTNSKDTNLPPPEI